MALVKEVLKPMPDMYKFASDLVNRRKTLEEFIGRAAPRSKAKQLARKELKALKALDEECRRHSGWAEGCGVLIHEDAFEDHARNVAQGELPRGAKLGDWPYNCIDWREATRALEQDYARVEFNGATYLIRK